MDGNTTMRLRSVSLKDVQGPVFIQNGGHMNNVIGNKSKGMVQTLFSMVL